MSILISSEIRRYEFFTSSHNFLFELRRMLQDLYTEDPYWEVVSFDNTNWHSQTRAWNNHSHTSYDNLGTIYIRNRKHPELTYTISNCMSMHYRHTSWGTRYNYHNYQLKFGLRPYDVVAGEEPIPDVTVNVGASKNLPFSTTEDTVSHNTSGTYHYQHNTNWKFTMFTHEKYIFIFGEYQDQGRWAFPFRLYLGELMPYETEDPHIADKFYGYFGGVPIDVNSTNWASHADYNVGRGLVRASRNNTEYEVYNFATSSQIPSPGLGGRYFLSPFYVFHPDEGVRGEFHGIRTAVLKDSSAYPDGSVLDVGDKRYYVFHINDQVPPSNYKSWRDTNGGLHHIAPYFFDSNMLYGGGQRVMLFEIKKLNEGGTS